MNYYLQNSLYLKKDKNSSPKKTKDKKKRRSERLSDLTQAILEARKKEFEGDGKDKFETR
jgi:hypothetical protein